MNKTFYIPEEKREMINKFIEACADKSYSAVLVELMEKYIKEAKK